MVEFKIYDRLYKLIPKVSKMIPHYKTEIQLISEICKVFGVTRAIWLNDLRKTL